MAPVGQHFPRTHTRGAHPHSGDAPEQSQDATRHRRASAMPLQCVTRCAEKFMKHSARVGQRFGELSQQAEQQMQQLMQQQGVGK